MIEEQEESLEDLSRLIGASIAANSVIGPMNAALEEEAIVQDHLDLIHHQEVKVEANLAIGIKQNLKTNLKEERKRNLKKVVNLKAMNLNQDQNLNHNLNLNRNQDQNQDRNQDRNHVEKVREKATKAIKLAKVRKIRGKSLMNE